MASQNPKRMLSKSALAGLLFTACVNPGGTARAQTVPTAVPVPIVSSAAGNGFTVTVSSSCTTSFVNTDNANYGDGCTSTGAPFSSPQGAGVDKFGNVYLADYSHRQVRVVYNGGAQLAAAITAANSGYTPLTHAAPAPTPVVGNVYTLAGTGVTTTALTVSGSAYPCANNPASASSGFNSLGDGCPGAAAVVGPRDVTVDNDGNVFITDYTDSRIRVLCVNCAASTMAAQLITLENPGVTPVNGAIYTIVGFAGGYRDAAIGFGSATAATVSVALLRSPTAAVVSSSDDVFIADNTNNAVRVLYNGGTAAKNILVAQGITPQQGFVYTIAGAGCVSAAIGKTGSVSTANACLTTAGSDTATLGNALGLGVAWTVYLDPNGNVYYTDATNSRIKVIYGGIAAPLTLPNTTYAALQTGYSYSFTGQGTQTTSGVKPNLLTLAASGAQGVGGDANGNIFWADYTTGLFYQAFAQTGIAAVIGGGNAIATPTAGAFCNGGTTGPTMDKAYNGCPLTQVLISNPRGPIVADLSGNLYFGDSPGSYVRRFGYNPTFPAGTVGAASAPQPYAFTFLAATTLTAPVFTTGGGAGTIFADGGGDTCTSGLAVSVGGPGTTCVVNATFTPAKPGLTQGAVELTSAAGVIGTSLVSGVGTGAGLNVDAGTSTVLGTNLSPNGIAVDGASRVLVADATSKSVFRYTGSNAATIATGFATPAGVAVDGAGNIFVADTTANTLTEIPVVGGTKFTLAIGLNAPRGLAVDGAGNVYVADSGNNRVVYYGPGGTQSVAVAFTGLASPQAVAVDAAGTVYAADSTHIVKLTAAGVQTTVGSGAAFTGLAVDPAGDVLASTATTLVEYPASGSAGTTLAVGITAARGLALDASGNAYLADSGAKGYTLFPRTVASFAFTPATTSIPVYLTSSGNSPLNTTAYTQTDSANFKLVAATTNGCSGALASGAICGLTASFTPAVSGPATDVVTFTGAATNASPITLTLTGTAAAQATTTTLTVSPASLVYGNIETLNATVAGTTSAPGNGTVNFFNGATLLGSAAVTNGVATYNFVPGVGTSNVTATFVPAGIVYTGSTATAKTFTVTPATLTVKANDASKIFGAANPAFTYSVSGFVNNDTQAGALTGTPAETTTATTASNAGTYPITITQGSLGAANYTFTFVNGTLTVTGASAQTITFGALPNVTYGAAPITLTATASSGLAVSYTVSGPATINGSTLTIIGVGTVAVTASQTGNNTYAQATPVTQNFTVAKASLTVTGSTFSSVYGATLPAIGYTITGFVYNETQVTATTGAPTVTATVTSASNVGAYPVTVGLGSLAATNYTLTLVNGAITITPATLTLTANSVSRAYGVANPTFTGTIAGAVNGDTLTESFSTTATTASAPGTYAIVPTAAGAKIGNYAIAATNGTLTITAGKSTVLLTAAPTTGFAGQTNIVLTATVSSGLAYTPTSLVSFYAGSTLLGTATLASGTATLSTTAIPVGTICVTAVYSGDTNLAGNTSACATVTIAAAFGIVPTTTALAFQPGYQEAQTFFTVNPGGRTDTLTFACSGLPAKLSCAFNPATLALSGVTTAQTVQLLVSNSSAKASVEERPLSRHSGERAIALAVLPFAALLLAGLRRRRLPMLLALALLTFGAAAGLSGCGSSPADVAQNSGTYPFTVTVSSGSTTVQTMSFTLTVP